MAINKEIWLNHINKFFEKDASVYKNSVNLSEFVNNGVIHVPYMVNSAAALLNNQTYPITTTVPNVTDNAFNMSKIITVPLLARDINSVELSFSKRSAVLESAIVSARNKAWSTIVTDWMNAAPVLSSGSSSISVIKSAMQAFNNTGIPFEGRHISLAPVTYNALLDDLTDAASVHFLAAGDPKKGIVGEYMGFKVSCDFTGVINSLGSKAFAWHKDSVGYAISDIEVFMAEKDPNWYGDILSCSIRAGGVANLMTAGSYYVIN